MSLVFLVRGVRHGIFICFLLGWMLLCPIKLVFSTEPEPLATWADWVSFPPEIKELPKALGTILDASHLAATERWIPSGVQLWMRQYGLEVKTTGYRPVSPSLGYQRATRLYQNRARMVDLGQDTNKRGLRDYVAGLPFPKPKTGQEVAWNLHYAYTADDSEIEYGVYWISANSGVEHREVWKLSRLRTAHRTDLEPIPMIESFAARGIEAAGLTFALAPYDKKGFGAVYFSFTSPRDTQGHTYIPSMRRVLKNSFGTRGDSWNATDLLFEDIRGYSGYPEWMHWKLISQKTVLLPMHSGVQLGKKFASQTYQFKKKPYWNPNYRFEPRPVYVLEAVPKLPDYPYGRQLLYVDAEAFVILYKESFDKKGQLWKLMLNSATIYRNENTDDEVLGWSGTVVVDLQSQHATVFHVHRAQANLGLDPDIFTVSNLRKRSR